MIADDIQHARVLSTLTELRTLVICGMSIANGPRWGELPQSLIRLRLSIEPSRPGPANLARLGRLEHMEIPQAMHSAEYRRALADLPLLRELVLGPAILSNLNLATGLPGVTRLVLYSPIGVTHTDRLAAAYPALESLTFRNTFARNAGERLELGSLAVLRQLRHLEIRGSILLSGEEKLRDVAIDRQLSENRYRRPRISLPEHLL